MNIVGFPNVGHFVLEPENTLLADSDLVLATSRSLYDKATSTARKVLYLPNATDFDHFSRTISSRPLSGVGHPIIGIMEQSQSGLTRR